MTSWLADTSVAVPLVQSAHAAHRTVRGAVGRRAIGLAAHAALETYSVLTRLPGDARLSTSDAATLIDTRFDRIVALELETQVDLVHALANARVAGGAVYDALIALTAWQDGSALLTRDTRAAATYETLGVDYEFVG